MAENQQMVLRTEDLVKKYRARTVVNHVSINVKQGEIVGLLGPNGAGKTTTFYMTVGLVTPNEGKIFLNDMEIQEMGALKTRLLDIVNTSAQDRTTIILRADAACAYGTVARIMSLAEDLKINVFLLTTSPAAPRGTVNYIEQE